MISQKQGLGGKYERKKLKTPVISGSFSPLLAAWGKDVGWSCVPKDLQWRNTSVASNGIAQPKTPTHVTDIDNCLLIYTGIQPEWFLLGIGSTKNLTFYEGISLSSRKRKGFFAGVQGIAFVIPSFCNLAATSFALFLPLQVGTGLTV